MNLIPVNNIPPKISPPISKELGHAKSGLSMEPSDTHSRPADFPFDAKVTLPFAPSPPIPAPPGRIAQWRCNHCKKCFPTQNDIVIHMKTNHAITNPRINGPGLPVKKSPSECHYCHKIMSDDETVKQHVHDIHGDPNVAKFKCDKCVAIYIHENDLAKHQQNRHPVITLSSDEEEPVRPDTPLSSGRESNNGDDEPKDMMAPAGNKSVPNLTSEEMAATSEQNLVSTDFDQQKVPADLNRDPEVVVLSDKQMGRMKMMISPNQIHLPHKTWIGNTSIYLQDYCAFCDIEFLNKTALNLHNGHTHGLREKGVYNCEICYAHFIHESHLKLHLTNFHSDRLNGSHKCDQCDKRFPRWRMAWYHLRDVHDLPANDISNNITYLGVVSPINLKQDCRPDGFSQNIRSPSEYCSKCKAYIDRTTMSTHMRIVHGNLDPKKAPYSCTECTAMFVRHSALGEHLKNGHDWEIEYKCLECCKIYPDIGNILEHLTDDHNIPAHSRAGGLLYRSTRFRIQNKNAPPEDLVNCKACNINFRTEGDLHRHVESIHGPEETSRFKCNICPAFYVQGKNLVSHFRNVHHYGVRFQCVKCPKHYGSTISAWAHVTSCHGICDRKSVWHRMVAKPKYSNPKETPEEKHPCDICQMVLNTDNKLRVHLENHGVVEYECVECHKTFGKQSAVTFHISRNHGQDGSSVHEGQYTRRRKNSEFEVPILKTETQSPSELSCHICPATFTLRTEYVEHYEKLHAMRAVFQCNICDEQANMSDMENHLDSVHDIDIDDLERNSKVTFDQMSPLTASEYEITNIESVEQLAVECDESDSDAEFENDHGK